VWLSKAAFYDSPIPQAITDLKGKFVKTNIALSLYFGYPEKELLGMSFRDFTPDDDNTPGLDLKKELAEKKYWSAKKKYVRKDGTTLHALLSVSGIYEEGELKNVLAQLQDQSTNHQLIQLLNTNQKEMEQFAYIASHDLREPLTTMAGYASLLNRRCAEQLDDDGKRWLDEILNVTKHMSEKIDDLLEFSRASRQTPHGSFPLGSAVEEAKRAVVRALKETDGQIELVGKNPIIKGDRSMVAQVFQNLFSNSLKYRSEATPKITVSAKPYEENKWLIAVKDNGLGFDMQFKDRIFRIFQRLYTIDQYPGTGIGLALAKKIVEAHDGDIWPESEPGKGTTFYFTLPNATP